MSQIAASHLLGSMHPRFGAAVLLLVPLALALPAREWHQVLFEYKRAHNASSTAVPAPSAPRSDQRRHHSVRANVHDAVRASVVLDDCEAVAVLVLALEKMTDVVRIKNRFARPSFHGYRDMLVSVAVPLPSSDRRHVCEVQIHLRPLRSDSKIIKARRLVKCLISSGLRLIYSKVRPYDGS